MTAGMTPTEHQESPPLTKNGRGWTVEDMADLFMDLRMDGPAADGWTYQQTMRHYAALIADRLGRGRRDQREALMDERQREWADIQRRRRATELLDAVEAALSERALAVSVQNRLKAAYNAVIEEANMSDPFSAPPEGTFEDRHPEAEPQSTRCRYVIDRSTHPGYPFGPFRCTLDSHEGDKHGGGGMEWTGGKPDTQIDCVNTGCLHLLSNHGPDGCRFGDCTFRWA